MRLNVSILDYEDEIGELSRGGDDGAPNLRHESSVLLEDLRGMVNNQEFSDVIFVCCDGTRVHACRMFLAARSAVSRQMLSNGMSETSSSVIPLPSISSSIFIQVLKFLYAGELESSLEGVDNSTSETHEGSDPQSSGIDWNLNLDIVSAAQFFLLDRLVKVTLRRMWAWLCGEVTVHGMVSEVFTNRVADGLTALLAYTSSSAEGTRLIEALCIRMVHVLVSSGMSELTLSKLSKEAFTHYLNQAQSRPSDDKYWKWSLEEYKKLIELLAWTTIKAGEEGEDTPNLFCLPSPVSAGEFILHGNESRLFEDRTDSEVTQNRQRLSTDTVKKLVQELLPFIDLPSVHPELLVRVIKPLKIIDAEVVDALSVQAIRTSWWLRHSSGLKLQRSHNWFCHEKRLAGRTAVGSVIFKMESSIFNGVRRVQTFIVRSPMHSYGRYMWSITRHVPNPPSAASQIRDGLPGFEFGFLRLYPGEELTSDALSAPLSSKTGFAMQVTDDLRKIEYNEGPSKAIWNLQAPFNLQGGVVILLDRVQNICKVTCSGCAKRVELKIPQGGLLYPAICLPNPELAVEIEFLEGFDRHLIYELDRAKAGELISHLPNRSVQFY